MRRLTTAEFIIKARSVHGDKYSYDKVKYLKNTSRVIITCSKHGDFEQKPNNHLCGSGCPKCSCFDTEDFIIKATNLHGGKYIYDKVKYINNRSKVIITCAKHGDFEQTPNAHLYGLGCKKCGGRARLTTEEFITKSRGVHGDTYDYSQVEYRNNRSSVTIICKVHGGFEQVPDSHFNGHGCDKCGGTEQLTTEEFITRARSVHGDTYDYSQVEYLTVRSKVTIICETHGKFKQKPHAHLCGHGCQKCSASKGEVAVREWLKKRDCQYEEQVRIASCKNKLPLPFDFMVHHDTSMMIEFHGIQHYEPRSFRSKGKDTQEQMEANLARIQHNDAIKTKWCSDNKIPLLVIPYWDKHRIPELLEEFLGSASLVGVSLKSGSPH